MAGPSLEAFQERLLRLYEQGGPPELLRRRVGDYVRRWQQWVRSGVQVMLVWSSFDGVVRPRVERVYAAIPAPPVRS